MTPTHLQWYQSSQPSQPIIGSSPLSSSRHAGQIHVVTTPSSLTTLLTVSVVTRFFDLLFPDFTTRDWEALGGGSKGSVGIAGGMIFDGGNPLTCDGKTFGGDATLAPDFDF